VMSKITGHLAVCALGPVIALRLGQKQQETGALDFTSEAEKPSRIMYNRLD